jgi:hypothetical protein
MSQQIPRFLAATLLGLALVSTAALAGPNSFRYADESQRLPADTNPPDSDTLDVELVDVDADGDLDLFRAEGTASPAPRPNLLYINNGSGVYSDQTALRLPPGPPANSSEVEFADVDGDGDLDGIVANLGPEQLLLNNGAGFFTDGSATHLPPPLPLFENISIEARFADVDADGDPDILLANENPFDFSPTAGAQNRIWINDGTGHYTDQTVGRLPIRNDQTQGFAVGDIDADGDLDAIVVNILQDFVLINDGTGHFTDETASRFPTVADATRKGILADFNGDGWLDLFMGNSQAQAERLYLNNGGGVFVDRTAGNVPAKADTTTDVEVADLDTDGDLDLYVVNAGAFQVGHGFLGEANVYLRNNGHGKFHDQTKTHFPDEARPSTSAAVGDVDGDDDLDLVIGNSTDINGGEQLLIRKRNPGGKD